jgi:hypothetical protein
MAWRSLAIRVSFIVCLLFGTCALAKKKPPAQPANINAATSEELQQVLGNWSLHRGKNSSGAQIMRPIQERGRFAAHSRAWEEAP